MSYATNGFPTTNSDWREVSKGEPCPICEKPDWCSLTGPEGLVEAVVCMRIESNNKRDNGGYLHRLRESDNAKMWSSPPRSSSSTRKAKPKNKIYSTVNEAVESLECYQGKRSATWTYHDTDGEPIGMIVRWDQADGKKNIRPISKYADSWRIGGMPEPRPLYELHKLGGAEWVYIVEGEKAADAAQSIGLVATTSPHGSKSAGKTDWSPLASKDCIILPDNDETGQVYADSVATILAKLTPVPTVRVVELAELPDGSPMPKGGDLVDWIDGHGDAAEPESMVSELEAMVSKAKVIELQEDVSEAPEPSLTWQPFPVDVLPEPLRSFVTTAAKAIGCDASYIVLPLLTALASAIGNSRIVLLKKGWCEPSILWTAIVGDSGSMKTPAFKLAMKALRDRQGKSLRKQAQAMKVYQEDFANHEKAMAAWKRDSKTKEPAPKEPEPPCAERSIVTDTTVEALAPILLDNPRGLLLSRDELSGWLGSFDRYSGGKGGGDSAHWLSMHGAESLLVDRKTGIPRTIHVPLASVSVTGGIQPSILRRALGSEHRESGLAARILLAYPPRTPKRWTESDIDSKAQEEISRLFERLYKLDMTAEEDEDSFRPVAVGLSADAKREWVAFYNHHAEEQAKLAGDLAAAWSKLEAYTARLALVMHCCQWAYGGGTPGDLGPVDAKSMAAGIRLVEWFKVEARRVYAMLAESEEASEREELVEWIRRKGGSVTARDVQQGHRQYRTAADAEAALGALAEADLGQWQKLPPGPKGGRPSRAFRLSTPSTSTELPGTRDSEGCVDVDNVDASETQLDDDWGEL